MPEPSCMDGTNGRMNVWYLGRVTTTARSILFHVQYIYNVYSNAEHIHTHMYPTWWANGWLRQYDWYQSANTRTYIFLPCTPLSSNICSAWVLGLLACSHTWYLVRAWKSTVSKVSPPCHHQPDGHWNRDHIWIATSLFSFFLVVAVIAYDSA